MRLDDYRISDNVGDQRGQSFGGGGGGGGGGGLFGLLFGLVLSRFGIGGVIVLGLLYFLFAGGNPLGVTGGTGVAPHQATRGGQSAEQICSVDAESRFSCQVLASTEDTWAAVFQERGQRYTPPASSSMAAAASRAAARRSPRWGRSTARPTTISISTPASTASFATGSARPATLPKPM